MNLVNVQNLSLRLSRKLLWEDPLTFSLPMNQRIAVLGPNGGGKTSFFRLLLGDLKTPYSKIFWGFPPQDIRMFKAGDYYRWFSYVPQETQAPAHLSVLETLRTAFAPSFRLQDRLNSIDEASVVRTATSYGISSILECALDEISSGERQRVYLARAVLQKAQVLVLDEPTNHLDRAGVSYFWEAVNKRFFEGGLSVLFSTHDWESARRVADHVLAINSRGLVYCGPASDFWGKDPETRVF